MEKVITDNAMAASIHNSCSLLRDDTYDFEVGLLLVGLLEVEALFVPIFYKSDRFGLAGFSSQKQFKEGLSSIYLKMGS